MEETLLTTSAREPSTSPLLNPQRFILRRQVCPVFRDPLSLTRLRTALLLLLTLMQVQQRLLGPSTSARTLVASSAVLDLARSPLAHRVPPPAQSVTLRTSLVQEITPSHRATLEIRPTLPVPGQPRSPSTNAPPRPASPVTLLSSRAPLPSAH